MGKHKDSISGLNSMSNKEIIAETKKFSERYRVDDGKKFRLKDYDTEDKSDLFNSYKSLGQETLQMGVQALDTHL